MNKIFIISDLHLGHANIIKLANRPFKTVEEMDNKIISNWNKVVGKDDLVYVLGDFCFKGKNADYYLNKLNGKIFLIKGNHDIFIKHDKIIGIRDYYELKYNGTKYILFHYPILSWNGMYRDTIHFYGHVHINSSKIERLNLPNSHNMNCELWNYTPQQIENFKPKHFITEMCC